MLKQYWKQELRPVFFNRVSYISIGFLQDPALGKNHHWYILFPQICYEHYIATYC